MLENISGSIWNFNMPRNMTKVEIKKILSEKFGDLRIFIMPDN